MRLSMSTFSARRSCIASRRSFLTSLSAARVALTFASTATAARMIVSFSFIFALFSRLLSCIAHRLFDAIQLFFQLIHVLIVLLCDLAPRPSIGMKFEQVADRLLGVKSDVLRDEQGSQSRAGILLLRLFERRQRYGCLLRNGRKAGALCHRFIVLPVQRIDSPIET